MKRKLSISSILVFTLFLSVNLSAGDSISGYWKTIDDKTNKPRSIVKIWRENGKYYGKILLLVGEKQDVICEKCEGKKKNKKIVGMHFLNDFIKKGKEYVNGSVLDPESGKIYRGKIWREGNRLKLRGYVLVFYRTQTWKITGKAEMENLFKKEGVPFSL